VSEPAVAGTAASTPLRERVAATFAASWTCVALLLAVVAMTEVSTASGASVVDSVVTQALINLVLVVSLYMFVGNSGIFSFGHLAFAAIGAYTAGILTIPPKTQGSLTGKDVLLPSLPSFLARAHFGPVAATLIAAGVSVVVAAVIALPLMRLSGIAASLATFAVLVIEYVIANNWTSVTNATSGLAGVPTTLTVTKAMVWGLVAIVGAFLFQQTRVCARLRASREDETAARSVGVGIYNERRLAFVLSAGCTAIGGALYAQYLGSFNADAFYIPLTFTIVAMLVVGGMTSLTGAVVGTAFLSVVAEGLRRLEGAVNRPGLQQVGFAVLLLAVLIWRPRGITLGRELTWPFGRRQVLRR
jgi:branched-chain amino acid transport system permease protein